MPPVAPQRRRIPPQPSMIIDVARPQVARAARIPAGGDGPAPGELADRGRDDLARLLARSARSRVLARMTFARFGRFGLLSNWGSYNAEENALLALEKELRELLDELEPWASSSGEVRAAREQLEELQTAVLAADDYAPTRGALGRHKASVAGSRERAWKTQQGHLRQAIYDIKAPPGRFDRKRARHVLDKQLGRSVGVLRGTIRQRRVDELRTLIDGLPESTGDEAVNAAHEALNAYDRQVGIPGVGYLGPSRTPDDQHVMTRGISEVVLIEGELYTPIYCTVYGDARMVDVPKHKDIGQDAQGRIQIHSGAAVGDSTFWMSIGRPLRQIKWLEKYAAQGAPEPLIRSFLIPLAVVDRISGASITEHQSSGQGKDLNVDKHYERNQFGVVAPASMELLRAHALPGSLRTYTDGAIGGRPSGWGEVRPADELRDRLGIPRRRIPNYAIFVTLTPDPVTKKREFTSKADYQSQVDALTRIYAYHTGNQEFLPVGGDGAREAMPPTGERRRAVKDFFEAHKPPELKGRPAGPALESFIAEYVAPWATQAQVAQALAEDYDDLAGPERASLPTSAPAVRFTPPASDRLRGQRRAAQVDLGRQHQALLAQRQRLRAALAKAQETLVEAFGDMKARPGGPPPKVMAALNALQRLPGQMSADYAFATGDSEAVRLRLPGYKDEARKQYDVLLPHVALSTNLWAVVEALAPAVT